MKAFNDMRKRKFEVSQDFLNMRAIFPTKTPLVWISPPPAYHSNKKIREKEIQFHKEVYSSSFNRLPETVLDRFVFSAPDILSPDNWPNKKWYKYKGTNLSDSFRVSFKKSFHCFKQLSSFLLNLQQSTYFLKQSS